VNSDPLPNSHTILHVLGWDRKFVSPFVDFINQHFESSQHAFLIHGAEATQTGIKHANVTHCPSLLRNIGSVLAAIRKSRKIIIHGLFSSHLLYILAIQPWMLKKCHWTMWGGDLYIHNSPVKNWRWRKNEWLRRFVISRLGHLITQIEGDFELGQRWYGAKGRWQECFMYPTNIFRDQDRQLKPHTEVNILLGNSATVSNNHLDAIEKLRPYAENNIRIYCPLSYGDSQYADQVEHTGKAVFGKKFIALRDFMPYGQYLELLDSIDIGIFNHDRQQGVGNIVALLGLGKKVYIRSNISSWGHLQSIGVEVFDSSQINIQPLQQPFIQSNIRRISDYYSEPNLIAQLKTIFL
jgi:dTDP-N-acetylfucosamine:lipid II N-acetylfucosaminyltransferase